MTTIDRLLLALRPLAALWVLVVGVELHGQVEPDFNAELIDRPISAIRLVGLKRVAEQDVYNNIRSAVGDPFDPQTAKDDVHRLQRLGKFKYVTAIGELAPDGSVILIFELTEHQIINEVQVVGNKLISNQDLLAVVQQVPRGPRDDFLIQNARRAIEEMYRKRGHYLTTVSIDETELDESGLLIFRVIEGPRVKVRAIEFQGNHAFTADQLLSEVKTRTAFFLLRKGELDEELLIDDVAKLDKFYKDRGYLDVRVDRTIDISPDNREAKVVFLIAEGERYTLRSVQATTFDGGPLKVFAPEQIAAIIELKTGDVYRHDLLRKSIKALEDSYGLMGYLDVRVFQPATVLRIPDTAEVDVRFEIDEGRQYKVGAVQINGNFLTRDKVIRRELWGMTPGRPFDGRQVKLAEERLQRTRLFNDVRITVQPEDPDQPEYRDVLVEAKERHTGSVNFGVAVASDSGLFGELSLNQNNFDISDLPESLDELLKGRAFLGGGQRFNATLRPGTDLFQYSMSLTEPHLMDSDYALTVAGQFRDRFYTQFDERRLGASIRLGRQLGEVWSASIGARFEQIELDNIDASAPTELFADAGPDFLTSLGLSLTRSTIGAAIRPGKGSRFELSFDRYGPLGGDFDFNLANAEYTVYFTLDEDFLGRLTTLRLTSRIGYIFGEDTRVPTYERLYLGGRSARGFEFRTISPKGIRADNGLPSDDPVGGTWLFFLGAQYEIPLLADALSAVVFIDSGTVLDDPGLEDYRVSIGAGLRIHLEQLSEVPIALDFGFPIRKEDDDETQLFTFSAEIPF